MPDAIIDVRFVTGLGLPYEPGAEASLDPTSAAAFMAVGSGAGVPLTLRPSFDLPWNQLGDLLAAARQGGVEPPDLLAWYAVACPEDVADAVVTGLAALPFVAQAAVRLPHALARWEVATDPLTMMQPHLTAAPTGVDAFAAWQVPGGGGRGARLADVEYAWDLHHPDLDASVTVLAPFPTVNLKDVDHGTASLGIAGAWTNGAASTGIAPWADLAVSPVANNAASAVLRAARHVGRGGIVLIEIGVALTPGADTGHVPLEHDPLVKAAIQAATALGVLVIEPAGNGNFNLDADPRFAHLGLTAAGVDSGALLVAAGTDRDAGGNSTGQWRPADFTTSGSRIGCFAAGENVTAPTVRPGGPLQVDFGGTSAAGAIVAGVAAALQGVAIAATGVPLSTGELRARLLDPKYGTLPTGATPTPKRVGVMPDLSKLIEGLGVPRIPPLTALPRGAGMVAVVRSGRRDINELEIVEWDESAAAWRSSVTTGGAAGAQVVCGHPVALHGTRQLAVTRIDAVTVSETGSASHRPFDLDVGVGLDQPWRDVTSPLDARFKISSPMSVVASGDRLLVAGLSTMSTALVVVAERKPGSREVVPTTSISGATTGHEPIFGQPNPAVRFDCPPVLADPAGSVVLVGVDRDGWIRFGQWSLAFGWSSLDMVERGLDPSQPPALAGDGPALHVIGLDPATGELREAVRSPDAAALFQWTPLRTIAAPPSGFAIRPAGAITAASDGAGTLMAMALDASGLPLATVRLPGLDWSPLFFVPTIARFVARGGLAVASPSPGVFIAAASDASGAIHTARWTPAWWTTFLAD